MKTHTINILKTICLAASIMFVACGGSKKAFVPQAPMPYQDWYKALEIAPSVYLLNDNNQATCYLVLGSERALLIDTGTGIGDLAAQVAALTDLPLTVVDTHGHNDHIGGNYQFDEVWIPAEDESMFDEFYDYDNRLASIRQAVASGQLGEGMQIEFDEETIKQYAAFRPSKVNTYGNGDSFDLGGGKIIEACALPGHTAGSMILIDRADSIVFSGDAIIEQLWMWLPESLPLATYAARLEQILPQIEGLKLYHGHDNSVGRFDNSYANTVLEHIDQIMNHGRACDQMVDQYGTQVAKYIFDDWQMLLDTKQAEEFAKVAEE